MNDSFVSSRARKCERKELESVMSLSRSLSLSLKERGNARERERERERDIERERERDIEREQGGCRERENWRQRERERARETATCHRSFIRDVSSFIRDVSKTNKSPICYSLPCVIHFTVCAVAGPITEGGAAGDEFVSINASLV